MQLALQHNDGIPERTAVAIVIHFSIHEFHAARFPNRCGRAGGCCNSLPQISHHGQEGVRFALHPPNRGLAILQFFDGYGSGKEGVILVRDRFVECCRCLGVGNGQLSGRDEHRTERSENSRFEGCVCFHNVDFPT